MKITLHTQMQDYGQMIDRIIIKCDGNAPAVKAEDFRFTNCCYDLSGIAPISGVKALEVDGDTVTVTTDFFLFRLDFAIECVHPQLTVKVTKETVDEVQLHHEELFKAITENGVNYRLYEPNAYGKRPLVLFLHGGGGSGEDNITQLTDTIAWLLTTLSPREAEVIRLRFGLGGGKRNTLEEIGSDLGVTRERVRQIESKALRKLRHSTRARYLQDFVA